MVGPILINCLYRITTLSGRGRFALIYVNCLGIISAWISRTRYVPVAAQPSIPAPALETVPRRFTGPSARHQRSLSRLTIAANALQTIKTGG